MSNFGKKYRKDPVKTFNRKQVSALHPRKPRKKSTNTTRAIKKQKPVEITVNQFLFWLLIFVLGYIFN